MRVKELQEKLNDLNKEIKKEELNKQIEENIQYDFKFSKTYLKYG